MTDYPQNANAVKLAEPENVPDQASLHDNVTQLPQAGQGNQVRMLEALIFASSEPVGEDTLAARLPEGADIADLIAQLQTFYAGRGVNLVKVAGKWSFRTSDDLSFLMRREMVSQKRLSRAALETLAIIAYHQPVTRAEIEQIRGVATSKGTLDILLEIGWIKMRGRRRTPGRPVTYGTSDDFMEHFALAELTDLPGLAELKGAGLLSGNLPNDFVVPQPSGDEALGNDEDPLEGEGDSVDEPPLDMHLPERDEQT